MGVSQHKISVVTDLDRSSGEKNGRRSEWASLLTTGSLMFDHDRLKASIKINVKDDSIKLVSEYSRGLRGMELSDLLLFNGKLYSIDDRTGIVFDLTKGNPIPWVILSNGDGNNVSGFKGEWMTKKDGKMYIGGHGSEYVDSDGTILNRHGQWIKIIEKNGAVEHVNWELNFDLIRNAVGCPFPGYLTHEAVVWSAVHKQWFFLPRKVSTEPYDLELDETRSGNLLIRCSENFKEMSFIEIGGRRKERGFSSLRFIPGTNDKVIVAIKSEEIGDEQRSFLTVFTIDGKVILDDHHFANKKFEGLEFVD